MEQNSKELFIENLRKPMQQNDHSGIHSIHIDLDKNILEINGEPVKRKMIVSLPASDGFYFQKGFNFDENNPQEESDRLTIKISASTQ